MSNMNYINHTDLLFQRCNHCNQKLLTPRANVRQVVVCPRCSSQLNDGRSWSLNRLSILAITLLMLAPIAFWQPLISIHLLGSQINANVIEGIRLINDKGDPFTASIVAFCAIAAPFIITNFNFIVIYWSAYQFESPAYSFSVSHIKEWVMLMFYLIALGIAAIKMQDYASVFIGHGLVALLLCLFSVY
ncbi:paraquat-inducible protein A [Providencia hangzhouensis]|uniref:paraquat-inducible protein A n=1 Tax=Providencia hangzhouensis TaxID=3031799 RepID=UPI0034DCE867